MTVMGDAGNLRVWKVLKGLIDTVLELLFCNCKMI